MNTNIKKLISEVLGILLQVGGLVFLFFVGWKIALAILCLAVGNTIYPKK